jgi:hypothetical protein
MSGGKDYMITNVFPAIPTEYMAPLETFLLTGLFNETTTLHSGEAMLFSSHEDVDSYYEGDRSLNDAELLDAIEQSRDLSPQLCAAVQYEIEACKKARPAINVHSFDKYKIFQGILNRNDARIFLTIPFIHVVLYYPLRFELYSSSLTIITPNHISHHASKRKQELIPAREGASLEASAEQISWREYIHPSSRLTPYDPELHSDDVATRKTTWRRTENTWTSAILQPNSALSGDAD